MKKITCFALAAAMVGLGGCSSSGNAKSPSDASQNGSGGVLTTGGTSGAAGGSASTGGSATSGGSTSTGGSSSSGGNPSGSGGNPSGGATATAGVSAPGGVKTTGGAISTGGIAASGGTARSGGNPGTGGMSGPGGAVDAGHDSAGGTGGAAGATAIGDAGLLAAESASFHCFNWADPGDNFQSGVLKPTGLTATDDYATVLAKANAILSGFQTVLGANAIRIPINEATIVTNPTWWTAYKGIIDAAISKNMKVMVAYWGQAGNNGGKPADTTVFYTMWKSVVDAYASSDLVYFDIMNEPWALSPTAFITFAVAWMAQFPTVPHNRVVVAGNYNDNDINQQGADPRLAECLLSLHIYGAGTTTAATTEANLKTHLGPYYSRAVVTEYTGGTDFMLGLTTQMKAYGIGSCFWAGLEGTTGIAKINGTGTNLTLTVNNASELTVIQSGWTP
jgi:hypothetical protein